MRNTKRLTNIVLVLIIAAAVATLVACGSDAEPEPASDPTATQSQPTSTTGSGLTDSPTSTTAPTNTSEPTQVEDPTPAYVPPTECEPIDQLISTTPYMNDGEVADGPSAPELTGITGWINAEPFTMEDLKGKVVLVDFWTYTCVNCIRTFPFLRDWHMKYADHGLVIVGVHAPEFEFEKVMENVENASVQHELCWPIAQDNDFKTWRAYSNRAWPSKYLVDKDGVIRYAHVGEGAYGETEQWIRDLLDEIGEDTSYIPAGTVKRPNYDPQADQGGQTRELYAGRHRNLGASLPYIANPEYYDIPPDTAINYTDPGGHMNHRLYLHGLWTNGAESVTHARETDNLEDYVAINFLGTTVNTVLDFDGGEPYKVYVTLAGVPIPQEYSGADIQWEEDGKAYFMVDEPRMYRVVELPSYGGTELILSSNSDRFSLFTFTFGSYVEGP